MQRIDMTKPFPKYFFGLAFFTLSILSILLTPIPLAYFLTLWVSDFEGARGYATLGAAVVIAFVMVILLTGTFLLVRHEPGRERATLKILTALCAISAVALVVLPVL